MTNPTPHGQVPEALPAIQRFEVVDCIDSKHVPAVIPKPHGPWVRYKDHAAVITALRTQQPAPATQQAGDVVAYLDVGAGGYLDLGSELSEDALQQLPKGRHALVIAGTYGIDGYVAAPQPSPTTQPAPQQEVQEPAAVVVPCHTPSGKRVALYSAKQDLPIGTQLYTAPQPSHQQEESKPHGWLYDWTHSSATGKPDTTYTGFTKDEAHARKHDNCTAVFTKPKPSPAAQGDALDTMRLDWLDADESRCVFHLGKSWYTRPSYGLPYRKRASLREAIDASRAAQEGK